LIISIQKKHYCDAKQLKREEGCCDRRKGKGNARKYVLGNGKMALLHKIVTISNFNVYLD